MKSLPLKVMQEKHFAESAIVCYVLIGFYSYPFVTILFREMARAPERSHSAPGGMCGNRMVLAVDSFLLHDPHCAFLGSGVRIIAFGTAFAMGRPWWGSLAGTGHLHWVFGWWEWMIIVLFMTAERVANEALVPDKASPAMEGSNFFRMQCHPCLPDCHALRKADAHLDEHGGGDPSPARH